MDFPKTNNISVKELYKRMSQDYIQPGKRLRERIEMFLSYSVPEDEGEAESHSQNKWKRNIIGEVWLQIGILTNLMSN